MDIVSEAIIKTIENDKLVAEGNAQKLKCISQNIKDSLKGALGDEI